VASKVRTPSQGQKIEILAIEGGSLANILSLPDPHFVGRDTAYRQLEYIDNYVRHPSHGCKSIILEDHYIDRDHIEDHSVFYSKSLSNYPNFCRRIHFFSLSPEELKKEIERIRYLRTQPERNEDFLESCQSLSHSYYIGFAVIKPLAGCPVGRTILRPLPKESGKDHLREFECICKSEVHTLGVPLTASGLPFQQQDLGVSACATTAIWMSLQRASQLEHVGVPTPSQITIRASQFALPFGRSMPSEGLSLDQMCQAVNSLGYSPNLIRCEKYAVTRALLFSSLSSGISPILVMESPKTKERHAIAVAGVAIRKSDTRSNSPNPKLNGLTIRHRSEDMIGLYVHDDRYGPYLKTTLPKREEHLLIRYHFDGEIQDWKLTHILLPLHPKIRFSFGELYEAGLKLLTEEVQPFLAGLGALGTTNWETKILRSHIYIDSLMRTPGMDNLVGRLCEKVRLSRYLGVIRFVLPGLDPFDVVLDTTSTARNLNFLATVQLGASTPYTGELCASIGKDYGATPIS